jgi:glycosyltransferase involved in cell wall biosynthesis
LPNVIVIIPAYNEEKTIDSVINNIKRVNKDVDILVVNDGSSDKTSFIAKNNGVTVIDLPFNLGICGCMQTGYKYAYKYGYDIAIQKDKFRLNIFNRIKIIIQSKIAVNHYKNMAFVKKQKNSAKN